MHSPACEDDFVLIQNYIHVYIRDRRREGRREGGREGKKKIRGREGGRTCMHRQVTGPFFL